MKKVTMKIIVAGYPKTGTKSMDAALEILGFSVYGYTENLFRLQKEWSKILSVGGTVNDFKRMYQDIDAVTDVPASIFWEEILEAFPDSKVILTMRNSEEEWVESFDTFVNVMQRNKWIKLLNMTSPTMWRLQRDLTNPLSVISLGFAPPPFWRNEIIFNKQIAKKKYRAHNAYVLQNSPKDQLLVYKVSEGWEPLCKFLGVPVPDQPFPRKNVRGSIAKDWLEKDPLLQKMKREMAVSITLIALLATFGVYKIIRNPPTCFFNSIMDGTKSIFSKFLSY